MNKNGARWALVTFALGVMCAIWGRFIPDGYIAIAGAFMLSFIFAAFGGFVVSGDK